MRRTKHTPRPRRSGSAAPSTPIERSIRFIHDVRRPGRSESRELSGSRASKRHGTYGNPLSSGSVPRIILLEVQRSRQGPRRSRWLAGDRRIAGGSLPQGSIRSGAAHRPADSVEIAGRKTALALPHLNVPRLGSGWPYLVTRSRHCPLVSAGSEGERTRIADDPPPGQGRKQRTCRIEGCTHRVTSRSQNGGRHSRVPLRLVASRTSLLGSWLTARRRARHGRGR